jgi:hypothetical protein
MSATRTGVLRRVAGPVIVAAMVAPTMAGPGAASAQVPAPVLSVGTAMVMETFARGDWVQALVPVTWTARRRQT